LRPEVLLLLGDTVYLEHDRHDDPAALAAELRRLYGAQFAEPHFAALLADLRARGGAVLSTYDDHDFLGNNRCGGDEAPALREAARAEFLRAFGLAPADGVVYRAFRSERVEVIVLDVRFYRRAPELSSSDPDAVLGADQWRWLEQTLAATTAPYVALASAINFHAFSAECWEHYPAAFERLRRLLRTHPSRCLILSGDIHRNALYDDSGVIEVVSSGVAKRGMVFGVLRQNYGVLDFGPEALHIELVGLRQGLRFDVTVPREAWHL
jgi:phosphodiesterase/alkaline phosphatase D-like protein